MRLISLLLCASMLAAVGGGAQAGDRYGSQGVTAADAQAPDWSGPILTWSNKSDAANANRAVQAPEPARPEPMSDWARRINNMAPIKAAPAVRPVSTAPQVVKATALPSSIYDAPNSLAAAAPAPPPAPQPYNLAKPAGQVITLSLADLPPPGPSLERQQAADDDAQALAAQVARANLQAAQAVAAGKSVPTSTTELLGGTQ